MKSRFNAIFFVLYIILGAFAIFTFVYQKELYDFANLYWKIYEPLLAIIIISSVVVLTISKEKTEDNWLFMALNLICLVVSLHAIWNIPASEFGYIVLSIINSVLAIIAIGYFFIRLIARD